MSIDGYIDSASGERLLLSAADDLDRVDAVRASCDAILVGAATIRKDNPRLKVRSAARRRERTARGGRPSPMKVTVTREAMLDATAHFFAPDGTEKLVYCPSATAARARDRLSSVATVVDGGPCVDMAWISEDLFGRGVRRLMVEGGSAVHTEFLTADIADELQLVVAPLFVGDSRAARFVHDGRFPCDTDRRATLVEVRQLHDAALLRYAMSTRFQMD